MLSGYPELICLGLVLFLLLGLAYWSRHHKQNA